MCRIPFQIFWQINNRNRLEGTFLDTNTATLVVKKLGTLELVRAVSFYSRCTHVRASMVRQDLLLIIIRTDT